MNKRLLVRLPGHVVGKLEQHRSGVTTWTPDPNWDSAGQHPRLGLDFLRARGPRTAASEIPAWFENVLPERESALRTRLCTHFSLRDGQSFELLASLGSDLPGAVEVYREVNGEPGDSVVEPESAPSSDMEAMDGAEVAFRPSALAGMQLKFSMSMVNDRLTVPASGAGGDWIVKIAGPEYEDLALVEQATMRWAQKATFDVPEHFTAPFEKLVGVPNGWVDEPWPVFAVRRFDRRTDGSRVHHEDLCQALGLRPNDKYGDRKAPIAFEGAIRQMIDACGDRDGEEMCRRVGFMIASGNSDAHLKNWGLLWGEQVRPSIAPCYDLVATISWARLGWGRRGGPRLALDVGRRRRFADLDEDALDALALGTRLVGARDAVVEGIERARAAYREIDVPIPPRMEEALAEHWRRVPMLKRMAPLPVSERR